MTIREAQRIYMIGIKGVGMTALAEVLHGWGKNVTGSDTNERFQTDVVLKRRGISYHESFAVANIPATTDLVIYSTAYTDTNIEIAEAKKRGIPILSYPEALGQLMEGKYGIAVAGSHGKTTTTALLGHVMTKAGLDPTVIVGSEVKNWGANARVGKSEYVVIEADEYQNKFQYYNPKGLIITNIDWDHPDFFPTKESYEKVFEVFVSRVHESGGWIVTNMNHAVGTPKDTWGEQLDGKHFPVSLIGEHNRKNAWCVWEVAKKLGIDRTVFNSAVRSFRGTARRFEEKGTTKNGVLVIDDYAHHPTEIRATLKAARERFQGKKIWVVFHPHTFTRTKVFFRDFTKSFLDANYLIVLDIYASAREKKGTVRSGEMIKAIDEYVHKLDSREVGHHLESMRNISTIDKAAAYLRKRLRINLSLSPYTHRDEYVVITMGAGDVWKVGEKLLHDEL